MSALVKPATKAFRRSAAIQSRLYSAPVDGSIPAAKQRFVPTEGRYPRGYLLGSAHAGVKPSNTTRDDVAIVASEKLCTVAGYYTKNKFSAAPVVLSKELTHAALNESRGIRGVVINSGCANAVTGNEGLADAVSMSQATDALFKDETTSELRAAGGATEDSRRTLVMSTGVIGQRLPIDKIVSTIPTIKSKLGNSHEHWLGVAKAVMTTDTFPKLVSRQFKLPSDPSTTYSIAGFSKGAGMIHPNMATMLSTICTDVKITPACLHAAGISAVNRSFNSISIDGDTSTNDTLALFANGAAVSKLSQGITEQKSSDFAAFAEELSQVSCDLAKLVVRDGEGATKFVTIHVKAKTPEEGRLVGRTIAVSPLVKTALYGKDANWGRILCAIGYADSEAVDPESVSVSFGLPDPKDPGRLRLVEKGLPVFPVDEALAKTILDEEEVNIYVDLVSNDRTEGHWSKVWTCDFSHEYVTINGDYRT